jgi:hypothetical protein
MCDNLIKNERSASESSKRVVRFEGELRRVSRWVGRNRPTVAGLCRLRRTLDPTELAFFFFFWRNFLFAAFFSETIVTIGIMGFGESMPRVLWNHRKTIEGGVRELGLEDSTSLAPSDRSFF